MAEDRYPLGFKVALHRKDLGIAIDLAKELGVSVPTATLVAQLEDALIAAGKGARISLHSPTSFAAWQTPSMPENTVTADPRSAILHAQYVALTTYRLDGRAVVTPVWAAEREGRLLIFSNPAAGKMKRLRNSPRASVAPCTWNGTLTGTPLPATARILVTGELGGMWGALVKYGLLRLRSVSTIASADFYACRSALVLR